MLTETLDVFELIVLAINFKKDASHSFNSGCLEVNLLDGKCIALDNRDIKASRKHTYIILTPLNPTLYGKTGVYRGIHYFSYFCTKT